MEGVGLMIHTAASHQGAIKMFWLHFWELLWWPSLYTVWSEHEPFHLPTGEHYAVLTSTVQPASLLLFVPPQPLHWRCSVHSQLQSRVGHCQLNWHMYTVTHCDGRWNWAGGWGGVVLTNNLTRRHRLSWRLWPWMSKICLHSCSHSFSNSACPDPAHSFSLGWRAGPHTWTQTDWDWTEFVNLDNAWKPGGNGGAHLCIRLAVRIANDREERSSKLLTAGKNCKTSFFYSPNLYEKTPNEHCKCSTLSLYLNYFIKCFSTL